MKDNGILICECSSTEHQIVFSKHGEDKEVYCQIHLSDYKNIFKRFVVGVKYIFGYKCKFGHWDEFILTPKHVEDLKEITNFLEEK